MQPWAGAYSFIAVVQYLTGLYLPDEAAPSLTGLLEQLDTHFFLIPALPCLPVCHPPMFLIPRGIGAAAYLL